LRADVVTARSFKITKKKKKKKNYDDRIGPPFKLLRAPAVTFAREKL
jgi:hypothetical protein